MSHQIFPFYTFFTKRRIVDDLCIDQWLFGIGQGTVTKFLAKTTKAGCVIRTVYCDYFLACPKIGSKQKCRSCFFDTFNTSYI